MIPLAGFALQGPGDEEDLAAAATEEPLTAAVAEELDGTLPEGPPLPVPTVASERAVTPVSGIRDTEIWRGRSYRGEKESPGRDLPLACSEQVSVWFIKFHIWAFEGRLSWEHTRKLQLAEEKARDKNLGHLPACPKLSSNSNENLVTGRAGQRCKGSISNVMKVPSRMWGSP